jgi:hypothetical protein
MEWTQIKELAYKRFSDKLLSDKYKHKLDIEILEIERQGTNSYWEDCVNNNEQWDTNPNGLVLPFVLGMTPIDPIKGGTHKIMIEGNSTDKSKSVIIELEDGRCICVSPYTMILTSDGYIAASEITPDHTIP